MTIPGASATRLEGHLRKLTVDLGVRLAGSDAERAAAEYLAAEASSIQGTRVTCEEFPVWERAVGRESLEVEIDGVWTRFDCSLFGAAPSTNGKTLEAPIVFFDTATGYLRDDLSFLRGRAVVHLGCHIETADNYRRLMEAEPAFLLFVDTRYPGPFALADGLFPAYVNEYGALPTLNVAYADALRWNKSRATRARLCVEGCRRKSKSQNVIVDLPGTEPEAGIIYFGGHHDTQAGTAGANDNAAASAAVVELAGMLAGRNHRRTLRLISFGAEEQLSVGSAAYVRRHRQEVEREGRFMFNCDGAASLLGWLSINYNGPDACLELLRDTFHRHDFYFELTKDVFPYTDQFPFAVCGVPGLWFHRKNCDAGVVNHHRHDDNMDNIDIEVLAAELNAAAEFLSALADGSPHVDLTWDPLELKPEIDKIWNTMYGGWRGLSA